MEYEESYLPDDKNEEINDLKERLAKSEKHSMKLHQKVLGLQKIIYESEHYEQLLHEKSKAEQMEIERMNRKLYRVKRCVEDLRGRTSEIRTHDQRELEITLNRVVVEKFIKALKYTAWGIMTTAIVTFIICLQIIE